MITYAVVNVDGIVEYTLSTTKEVKDKNFISIEEGFDTMHHKWDGEKWIDYTPTEAQPQPPTEQELLQGEMLLNQAEILAKQNEQDEVMAQILLNQMEV